MEKVEAAAVGAVIGVLYGFILSMSYTGFSGASSILYGNRYIIPVGMSLAIAVLALVAVLTYPLWIKLAQIVIAWLAEALRETDELDGDEIE